MQIEVADNPNCRGSEQFVFRELGAPRPIRAIRVEDGGRTLLCEVTGVEETGKFTAAHAVKIADSGAGYAYLIFGGVWGIRLKKQGSAGEAWDLLSRLQWGEPFKIYGEEEDIVYAEPP